MFTSARTACASDVTSEQKFGNPLHVPCRRFVVERSLMPSWFEKLAIEPKRIRAMRAAFNKACAELGLSPTPDRRTEILVTKVIDLCLAGECDSARLSEIVVAYFRAGEPTESGNG
jgi:hypothetical protein